MPKPMVLTKENVIAVMEGRKTMTRRIINPQPNVCPSENHPINHPNSFLSHVNKHGGIITGVMTIQEYAKEYAKYQVGDKVYIAEGYKFKYANLSQFSLVARTVSGRYTSDDSKFEMQLTEKEWKLFKARKDPYRHNAGRFMYKSLARTFMTITDVRVERLQEISMDDCFAEGITETRDSNDTLIFTPFDNFKTLWDSIHGPGAWDRNDWVWVNKWAKLKGDSDGK